MKDVEITVDIRELQDIDFQINNLIQLKNTLRTKLIEFIKEKEKDCDFLVRGKTGFLTEYDDETLINCVNYILKNV